MRSSTLRLHWICIGLLLIVTIAGAIAARASSRSTELSLRLVAGEHVTVPVFRLLPDRVRLSMEFARGTGGSRRELGDFRSRQGDGYIEFELPGAPVVVSVEVGGAKAVYEALPAGGFSGRSISRDFVVLAEEGDPSRFRWPPDLAARPPLPRGTSDVRITVLEVGDPLVGEQVTAFVAAPLSIKTFAPGYGFLAIFLFWQVPAMLLALYAAVMTWFTWHSGRTRKFADAHWR